MRKKNYKKIWAYYISVDILLSSKLSSPDHILLLNLFSIIVYTTIQVHPVLRNSPLANRDPNSAKTLTWKWEKKKKKKRKNLLTSSTRYTDVTFWDLFNRLFLCLLCRNGREPRSSGRGWAQGRENIMLIGFVYFIVLSHSGTSLHRCIHKHRRPYHSI